MHAESVQPTAIASPLRFARFEFKYVLPLKIRKEIEEELSYFLQFDPFVENRPDNQYVVRSLYFDDPTYSAFTDKVDGLHSRYKFRLRTYAREPDTAAPIFLEIKGRHNNLVFKKRVALPAGNDGLRELNGAALTQAIVDCAPAGDVSEQFRFDLLRKSLRPVALIDYDRRPYVSKYDSTFRLTFDESLLASNEHRLFPSSSSSPRKILAGYTVLEVKFRHHLPSWFHRLIQTHELRRVSVSKICAGMEVLGLAFDEN